MPATVTWSRLVRADCLAAVLVLGGATVASAAVPWTADTGATRALLVATDGPTVAELDDVAKVLQDAYGAAPSGMVRAFGVDARTDDIEKRLVDIVMQAGRRDTVIVVLALPQHDKGQDRLLVTSDFDRERPWSGFSLDLVQKLSAGSSAGNLWLFVPGCAQTSKGDGYSQMSSASVRNSYGGSITIKFCDTRGERSPEQRAVHVLARVLKESAQSAARRGSGDRSGVTGMVTSDELVSRLGQNREGIRFSVDGPASGAVLRVRATIGEADSTEVRNALDAAADDAAAIAVLDRAVESGRSARDPSAGVAVADTLANYALDTGVAMTRRGRAVQAIGGLPTSAARPALERVFNRASESQLRAAALGQWRRVAEKGDLSLVRQGLEQPDPVVQVAAIQAAAASRDKGSSEAVIGALNTARDPAVRTAAARAMTDLADASVAEAVLNRSLADPEPTVRAESARALGRLALSGNSAARLMQLAVEDSSAVVRESSCYALAAAWPQLTPAERAQVEEKLTAISSGSDVDAVRIAALYSLARSGRVGRSDSIVAIARNARASPALRKASIEAMGQLRMTSAVPSLVRLAANNREATDLRIAATAALGHIPSSEAADALWTLSAAESVDVAAVARRTLEQGAAYSPAAAAAAVNRAGVSPERRVAAVRALSSSRDPNAIAPLIDALDDTDVAESAVAALAKFNDDPSATKVAAVLDDAREANQLTRVGAAFAIAAMDTDFARQQLARHQDDPDEEIRVAVAVGLGTAAPSADQYAALETLSRDANPIVRTAAAASLGRVESVASSSRLEELAKDDDPDVRAAAVDSLRTVRARSLGNNPPHR